MNGQNQISMEYQIAQKGPGSTLMKVSGILMIVFGSIGIIVHLLTQAGAAIGSAFLKAFGDSSELQTKMESLFNSLSTAYLIALIGAIMLLVSGILALVYSKKIGRGTAVILFCGIVIILNIIFNIVQLSSYSKIMASIRDLADPTLKVSGFSFSNILAIATGIILPILAIIGTLKNKKAAG